jgi:hypothetical protein
MTPQEAFKFGFKMQCAREGLDDDATAQRAKIAAFMTKQAVDPMTLGTMLSGLWGGVKSVAGGAKSLATLATTGVAKPIYDALIMPAMLAPPAVGVLGGYLASRSMDDHYNEDDARKDEELAEYERAIDQITRSSKQTK